MRYSSSSSSLRNNNNASNDNNNSNNNHRAPIVNVGPINITNFSLLSGMVGGSSSSSSTLPLSSLWSKKQQKKQHRIHVGWCIARLFVLIMIILWVGALVAVVKTIPQNNSTPLSEASSSSSQVASPSQMDRGLYKHNKSGTTGTRGPPKPKAPKAIKPVDVNAPPMEETTVDLSDISIFHTSIPNKFQFNNPIAPSCDIPLEESQVTFTLVTQLSDDRIWMIQHHCNRWGITNPLSIVVFTDRDAVDVKAQLVSEGCSPDHLTVQTVSKSKYDPSGTEYPVNVLRNLAFSAVKTTHAVYADVDFWPSSELHSLLSSPTSRERFAGDASLATVIPAFQMNRRCRDYRDCRELNIPSMPKHKKALLSLVGKREASSFDPTNAGGHGSTKYITWRDQESGTFKDLPCIKSNRYEPYLAVRYCGDLPPFQEGFTGYGKNKMTVR